MRNFDAIWVSFLIECYFEKELQNRIKNFFYSDQAGIVDQLTQFLVSLYEEPEKPTDAVGYMKKSLGNGKFFIL